MLEKLQTRNYLKAKKHDLSFDPCITTLVGKSAIGKSSLIRSLRWLCLNIPKGTNFINWDAKQTAVCLSIDKHRIIRKRSKTLNTYQFDKKIYKAFKNNIPDSIESLLKVSSINFQSQHEAHFWFSLSAPEVGRQLNSIVNLDLIDRSQKTIASKIRETKSVLSVSQQRTKECRKRLSDNSYIIAINNKLSALEILKNDISSKTHEDSILSGLISEAIKYRDELNIAGNQARQAKSAMILAERLDRTEIQVKTLQNLLKRASLLHKLSSIKIKNIEYLKDLKSMLDNKRERVKTLTVLLERTEQWQRKISQQSQKAKAANEKIKQMLKNKCPLCGQTLTKLKTKS